MEIYPKPLLFFGGGEKNAVSKCNIQHDIHKIVQNMCQTHLLIVVFLINPRLNPFQTMLSICIIRISISDANEISPVAMPEPFPVIKFTQTMWDCKYRM